MTGDDAIGENEFVRLRARTALIPRGLIHARISEAVAANLIESAHIRHKNNHFIIQRAIDGGKPARNAGGCSAALSANGVNSGVIAARAALSRK